jgi:hypothetical protein
LPSLGGNPAKLVYTSLSQYDGVQLIEEQSKEFQFPIMRCSNKINVPLKRAIGELKIICHGSIPKANNGK